VRQIKISQKEAGKRPLKGDKGITFLKAGSQGEGEYLTHWGGVDGQRSKRGGKVRRGKKTKHKKILKIKVGSSTGTAMNMAWGGSGGGEGAVTTRQGLSNKSRGGKEKELWVGGGKKKKEKVGAKKKMRTKKAGRFTPVKTQMKNMDFEL